MPEDAIVTFRARMAPLMGLIKQTVEAPIPADRARALLVERRGLRVVALAARQIRDIAVDTDALLKAEQAVPTAPPAEEEQEPTQIKRRGRQAA